MHDVCSDAPAGNRSLRAVASARASTTNAQVFHSCLYGDVVRERVVGAVSIQVPPHSDNRRRETRGWIRLVLFAVSLASLFFFGYLWRWLHVSIAVPPSSALSARDIDSIAVGLATPPGFSVNAYAMDLGEARVMVLTPKGDIVLSSLPSKVLLVKKDSRGNGRSDGVETLLSGLHNPSGLFLDGDQLYIAEEARVLRVGFDSEARKLTGPLETIVPELPHDGQHFTRTIKKGPDGFFYLTIGSSCNVCIEKNPWRAAMIRFKPGEPPQLFASGLRNTVGFDWQPGTDKLYGVDNGRDWLGDNLPPDEVNHVVEGGFYGWPYLYGDNEPDPVFGRRAGDQAGHAIPPVYKLPAHVAPLSILFLRHATDKICGCRARGRTWQLESIAEDRLPSCGSPLAQRSNHRRTLPHRFPERRPSARTASRHH